jgi:hypothetical protein
VTWGELRVALWLSVVCAVTAALLAVPAGAAEFLVDDLTVATFGKGVHMIAAFRDEARMERHEPFTVDFDWGTPAARGQYVLASVWEQAVALFFFPVCYVAYLGSSLRVCCLAFGSVALAFTVASAGFMLSGKRAFLLYSPVLGFALLTIALKLLCPRGSKIPTQAIKQALVLMVGNLLVMNVIPETTVRESCRPDERRLLTRPCISGPGSLPADVCSAQHVQGDRQVLHGLRGVLPHRRGPRERGTLREPGRRGRTGDRVPDVHFDRVPRLLATATLAARPSFVDAAGAPSCSSSNLGRSAPGQRQAGQDGTSCARSPRQRARQREEEAIARAHREPRQNRILTQSELRETSKGGYLSRHSKSKSNRQDDGP